MGLEISNAIDKRGWSEDNFQVFKMEDDSQNNY